MSNGNNFEIECPSTFICEFCYILCLSTRACFNLSSNNVLQLEIFYKELAERKVSQHKAYEYQSLLGE